MRIQDYVAQGTRAAADSLIHATKRTPEDKQVWKPLDTGRDVHDQLLECARINLTIAEALQAQKSPEFRIDKEAFNTEHDTIEKAVAVLDDSTSKLISVINDFPNDKLAVEFDMPFGPVPKRPFAYMLGIPTWNMTYHFGQICYIQTLFNDWDM